MIKIWKDMEMNSYEGFLMSDYFKKYIQMKGMESVPVTIDDFVKVRVGVAWTADCL